MWLYTTTGWSTTARKVSRRTFWKPKARSPWYVFYLSFFPWIELKNILLKKRCPSVCLLASSAASRTVYSPPVRKIRRRWKSQWLAKLWCYRWWLSPVLVRMQRRTRNRCGRRKRLSTRCWRTWRTPRRKGRRRDRRAEDDKLFLRNLKDRLKKKKKKKKVACIRRKEENRESETERWYVSRHENFLLFPFVGKRMTRESDDDEKTMKRYTLLTL